MIVLKSPADGRFGPEWRVMPVNVVPAASEALVGLVGPQGPAGPQGLPGAAGTGGLSAYIASFQLATIANATIIGGADVPFSNNGPMSGITHTAGSTVFMVATAGVYEVEFVVSHTAGVGAAFAVAVNGSVSSGTSRPVLTATGQTSGKTMLSLSTADVITLRNNSAVPLVLALAPSASAQITIKRLN